MFKYLAPSGSPIKTKEFLYWLANNLLFHDKRSDVQREITEIFHSEYCFLFSTGRGAMTVLLKSLYELKNDRSKNEVIIPAYTCYSVASSIINAGLKIRLCDIDRETLSYDIDELEKMTFDNVLCLVTANLYGIPNQLDKIEDIAKTKDIYMIDDAAQSFLAKYSGKNAGTFGTAGLYSLDKGKNVTSIDGGAVITSHKRLSEIMTYNCSQLPEYSVKQNMVLAIKVIVYYLLINPFLYWLPASLPFLKLGATRYEDEIQKSRFSRLVAPIALMQLKRSKSITNKRTVNGNWYGNNIVESKILKKIKLLPKSSPVFLRFPVKIGDKAIRSKLLDIANRYGITLSYPKSLNRVEEIQQHIVNTGSFIGAETVSEQIVTLPTHTYINDNDKIDIKELLEEVQLDKNIIVDTERRH